MSKKKAAIVYKIPRGTLQRHLKGTVKDPAALGRFRRVFDDQFETELVSYCLEMQKRFYGLTLVDCRKIAFELAVKNNLSHPFNPSEGLAGPDWMYSFMKRHLKLTLREPEATSLSRATGFNRVQVSRFYDLLGTEMEKYGFSPDKVYNVDETGITCVHKPVKIIAQTGQKQIGKIVSGERGSNITVVCSVNATGNYVPPMFIYPRKHMTDRLLVGTPTGSIGFAQQKGWMDSQLFTKWLDHFINYVKPSQNEKVLLLLDGHVSHKTLAIVEKARESGIVMICFPPHTTHKMQPLDVSFFGPLKRYVREASDNWMINHVGKRITDYDMASIFCTAYIRSATMRSAINGFRATGISPYNPDIFDDVDFASALTTEQAIESLPQETLHNERQLTPQDGQKPSEPQQTSIQPDVPEQSTGPELSQQDSVQVVHCSEQSSSQEPSEPQETLIQPDVPEQSTRPELPQQHSVQGVHCSEQSSSAEQPQQPLKRVSVLEVSPLPKAGCSGERKRRAQKAEVLTSTPNKKRLEDEMKAKSDKEERKALRAKKKSDKKQLKPKNLGLSFRKTHSKIARAVKPKPIPRSAPKPAIDAEATYRCLYCNEWFVDPPAETWIQCSKCLNWCHESCVAPDGGTFVCDFCMS